MNKYVVAFLSMHDGELRQLLVTADSKLDAYRQMLDLEFDQYYWTDYVPDLATCQDVESMVFDSDAYISALKISS